MKTLQRLHFIVLFIFEITLGLPTLNASFGHTDMLDLLSVEDLKNTKLEEIRTLKFQGNDPTSNALRIVQSASEGDTTSEYLCGFMYEFGIFFKPDLDKALEFYQKASSKNHIESMIRIAWIYFGKEDQTELQKQAYQILKETSTSSNIDAKISFGMIRILAPKTDIDKQEGFNAIKVLAEKGEGQAQYLLGACYFEGLGCTQNFQEALTWYQKATEKGSAAASSQIGLIYAHALGVQKDPEKAFEYNKRAAELGDPDAQHNLGNAYLNGRGASRNPEEALKWFLKAVRSENSESMTCIALIYFQFWEIHGKNSSEEKDKYIFWINKALALENPLAQYIHSIQLDLGEIAEKNSQESFSLLFKSALGGFPLAQLTAGKLLSLGFPNNQKEKPLILADKIESLKWFLICREKFPEANLEIREIKLFMTPGEILEAETRAQNFKPENRYKGKTRFSYQKNYSDK